MATICGLAAQVEERLTDTTKIRGNSPVVKIGWQGRSRFVDAE
jgi:hypothetical protein